MSEFWERAFVDKQLMWGTEPTRSAVIAAEQFAQAGISDVLIPGVGYGRNAKPFLAHGMAVSGIEVSATAIALARDAMGLTFPIQHGSIDVLSRETRTYDGIFCYGLAYLLDPQTRARFIQDCFEHLRPSGQMIFTVVDKSAPLPTGGTREIYDEQSIAREFGPVGLVEFARIDEPGPHGVSTPFYNVLCAKADEVAR